MTIPTGVTLDNLDYEKIFIEWLALFELPLSDRKKILDSLHLEIKNGFGVIAKSAFEELQATFVNQQIFQKISKSLEECLSFQVYGGYMLYLTGYQIDPFVKNLKNNKETEAIGTKWIEQYEKDGCKKLMSQIDPILGLFIEKAVQLRTNQLIMLVPQLVKAEFNQVTKIENFLGWAGLQGMILANLENEPN